MRNEDVILNRHKVELADGDVSVTTVVVRCGATLEQQMVVITSTCKGEDVISFAGATFTVEQAMKMSVTRTVLEAAAAGELV